MPVRKQLSRANRATCCYVNWLALVISILFSNLSRVKLRATIDDNAVYGIFEPFPPLCLLTRDEFNSREKSS